MQISEQPCSHLSTLPVPWGHNHQHSGTWAVSFRTRMSHVAECAYPVKCLHPPEGCFVWMSCHGQGQLASSVPSPWKLCRLKRAALGNPSIGQLFEGSLLAQWLEISPGQSAPIDLSGLWLYQLHFSGIMGIIRPQEAAVNTYLLDHMVACWSSSFTTMWDSDNVWLRRLLHSEATSEAVRTEWSL